MFILLNFFCTEARASTLRPPPPPGRMSLYTMLYSRKKRICSVGGGGGMGMSGAIAERQDRMFTLEGGADCPPPKEGEEATPLSTCQ